MRWAGFSGGSAGQRGRAGEGGGRRTGLHGVDKGERRERLGVVTEADGVERVAHD